jgi:hypothetical protein
MRAKCREILVKANRNGECQYGAGVAEKWATELSSACRQWSSIFIAADISKSIETALIIKKQ